MSFGRRRLRTANLFLTLHVFVTCVVCKSKSSFPTNVDQDVKISQTTFGDSEEKLEIMDEANLARRCSLSQFVPFAIPLPTHEFDQVRQKVDLIAKIMGDYFPHNDERILKTFLQKTTKAEQMILSGRLIWVGNGSLLKPQFYVDANYNGKNMVLEEKRNFALKDLPWMDEETSENERHPQEDYFYGSWSNPYFLCKPGRWLISYTAFAYSYRTEHKHKKRQTLEKMVGLVSVDVDVSDLDVNQCDVPWVGENSSANFFQLTEFLSTHKCHNSTSECIFIPGEGWSRGSYSCRCRDGYYSPAGKPIFNGHLVESAWKEKQTVQSPTYDVLYVCRKCQKGCTVCVDDTPCLSHYNWAFRISLLTISVICILLTLLLALNIYRYRKLKVIKVASPIFLCITLLGCATMYCEMAAIFPVLDVYSCVATKWTRNMGFCITYSALLLKTWRVSLTYRVKSAHKLKLTDKQLLQWLFPILLVMAIYLGTWTISSPPEAVYIVDWFHLKFKICDYNWWDHSLAIGELVFLLWGIRVCYNVRNAESFFNEAKHITWAVYNITIVNLIMLLIHLVILPNAGPDVKYLFGFIRTQLSTTVTIILIFGPKFYRVIKGQGDTWDNRARARGVTASFSLNGVGLVHEETPDLFQENEELKEEIQKLAAQIEFMKIVHMEMNNRHLKPKHGSFFSQTNSNQSPVTKSIYMKFESTDSPGSRISPAAELISEHV